MSHNLTDPLTAFQLIESPGALFMGLLTLAVFLILYQIQLAMRRFEGVVRDTRHWLSDLESRVADAFALMERQGVTTNHRYACSFCGSKVEASASRCDGCGARL